MGSRFGFQIRVPDLGSRFAFQESRSSLSSQAVMLNGQMNDQETTTSLKSETSSSKPPTTDFKDWSFSSDSLLAGLAQVGWLGVWIIVLVW